MISNTVMGMKCGRIRIRYPFRDFRKSSSIYDYIGSTAWLRYMGLFPVRRVQEHGKVKYKPYVGILYLTQLLVECLFIISIVIYVLKNTASNINSIYSFEVLELFTCVMFGMHVITSKFDFILHRTGCVISLHNLYEADILLGKLGIRISYSHIILVTEVLTLSLCPIYIMLFVYTYGSEAQFVIVVLQIWRFAVINIFCLIVTLLYIKYKDLNKFLTLYIQENEEGIPLTDNTMEPLEVINTIANIYDKLCSCGQQWNTMHNISLSVNFLFYSIGLTLFSIALYTSFEEMTAMIPAVCFFTLEFFYILTVSQMARNECQKIMYNINEMSCCYIDSDLWRARNSFLLQTLHQRVSFDILHVLPMDYNLAIKIGGVALSVLVLAIQIRSLEDLKT